MIDKMPAVSALAALTAIVVWRRPRGRRNNQLLTMRTWLETFSPDAYRPMLRLIESRDTGFLATQRGPAEVKRYRCLQRRMLRGYLHALYRDFHRLQAVAAAARSSGGHDGQKLELAPAQQEIRFLLALWNVEFRLLLNRIAPCAIDIGPLLANVGFMTEKARYAISST
jgi:hypothetical protein